jgi:predicted enzyme related to lactoylglutathione lyase
MKRNFLTGLVLVLTFSFGFVFKSFTINNKVHMKKVTGIGGIFFKCKDPQGMRDWYQKHLGLQTDAYGATFEWYEDAGQTQKARTQWTPFAENTDYFGSPQQGFMINYRVENLEQLVETLRKEGVTIVDSIETYDYGKFVHILDAEGNRVELWEASGE